MHRSALNPYNGLWRRIQLRDVRSAENGFGLESERQKQKRNSEGKRARNLLVRTMLGACLTLQLYTATIRAARQQQQQNKKHETTSAAMTPDEQ